MNERCQYHPNAPAIDHCTKCDVPLCGMCASFTDDGIFCESCAEAHAAEQAVAVETEKLERKESEPAVVQPLQEEPATAVRKKQRNPNTIPLVVIVACLTIIAARLLFFSTPEFTPLTDEQRAQQLAIESFEECFQVFAQIGRVLGSGSMPGDNLRCDGSGQANIVIRTGDDVIIEHPQPEFYGYARIYVSRRNPVPTLVR